MCWILVPLHALVVTRSNTRKTATVTAAVSSRNPEVDVVSEIETNMQISNDANTNLSIIV